MWYGDSTQNEALIKSQTQYFAERQAVWALEGFEKFYGVGSVGGWASNTPQSKAMVPIYPSLVVSWLDIEVQVTPFPIKLWPQYRLQVLNEDNFPTKWNLPMQLNQSSVLITLL